jgi:hypothetical protein
MNFEQMQAGIADFQAKKIVLQPEANHRRLLQVAL